jgi:hypothetical protein
MEGILSPLLLGGFDIDNTADNTKLTGKSIIVILVAG